MGFTGQPVREVEYTGVPEPMVLPASPPEPSREQEVEKVGIPEREMVPAGR